MGETSNNEWLDQYIGITNAPKDCDDNLTIYSGSGVRFYLQAFCDYRESPRFACRNQKGETYINHLLELFSQVLGTKIEKIEKRELDEFRNQIKTKWFVFEPQMDNGKTDRNLLPESSEEVKKIPYCSIEKVFDKPKRGDWTNAIAVPVFSSVDTAQDQWFKTDRHFRSKLVIISNKKHGLRYFYSGIVLNQKPLLIPLSILSEDTYYDFEDFPYVLLSRAAYVSVCKKLTNLEQEFSFLDHFKTICRNKGYLFEEKDLRNFHTSVKSGYLTILEGLSGTGKSSIVRLYKEAFGDNCKLCFLSVSPAWTDDAELLGYWDPRDHKYVHTELLDFLLEAQENQHCLYLICLDEMNLARVEHYFYRILSVMEKPLGERTMLLHNDKEDAKKCVRVEIGDNVRFVGTVNIDDTTFSFADKVRDRANIISLQVEDYGKNPFSTPNNQQNNGISCDTVKQAYFFSEFVKTYDDWARNQNDNGPEAHLRKFLWSLHEILRRENRPFGVSPRTVKAIGTYLANYPDNDGNTLNTEALDFQVNQRILTKLHGSAELLEELLKEYQPPVADGEKSSAKLANEKNLQTPQATEGERKDADKKKTLDQLLYEKHLTTSCATLSRKRKELENYGYCP